MNAAAFVVTNTWKFYHGQIFICSTSQVATCTSVYTALHHISVWALLASLCHTRTLTACSGFGWQPTEAIRLFVLMPSLGTLSVSSESTLDVAVQSLVTSTLSTLEVIRQI